MPMKATPLPPQDAPLSLYCQRALRDAPQHLPVRRHRPSGDERARAACRHGLPVGMMLVAASTTTSRRSTARRTRSSSSATGATSDRGSPAHDVGQPVSLRLAGRRPATTGCARRAGSRTSPAPPTSCCASSPSRSSSTRRSGATARAMRRSSTPTNLRLSWYDLNVQGRRVGRRTARARPAARRPRRHLGAEPARMAADAVRHRAHRR